MIKATFWMIILLIIYVYFGYPALLLLISRVKRVLPTEWKKNYEPSVSIIIAAYNEEKLIAQKIENCLELNYTKDKIEIIVVSDGSTDKTAEIIRGYLKQGIQLINLPYNKGKSSAQNEAFKNARGDIMLFTDANVILQKDAVLGLTRHFQNPRVGCVIGKVTYTNENQTAISQQEGFYWRYELFLRHKESQLGILTAGSGPIMAIKKTLFVPLDPSVSEDFVLPMYSALKGFRTVYEPKAISSEKLFQASYSDMFKTKLRTITLDTRGIFLCRAILNPFRHFLYAWGLLSHKILRWLVPYFLIFLFMSNLAFIKNIFYGLIIAMQFAFYIFSIVGFIWQKKSRPPLIFGIPFFFCLINGAALVGVARFLLRKEVRQWTPVRI